MKSLETFLAKLKVRRDTLINRARLRTLTRRVAHAESQAAHHKGSVVVFNASTRLGNLSLNAAFSALIAWGLRISGRRVVHFVCQAGMSRCLLGTSEENPDQPPPCANCTAFSRSLYARADVFGFHYQQDAELAAQLKNKQVADLYNFTFKGLPLGEIVLPSLRWRMRRHNLAEDRTTNYLYKEFILSAYQVAKSFTELLEQENPSAVIVFNGQMFPEAIVRTLAGQRGLTVLSHETGLQPYTVYITKQEATARRVFLLEDELHLTEAQNAHMDRHLEERFQGKFSMAGIQFWKDMKGLPEEIKIKLGQFRQMVPVFTNVIFDTSQVHANVGFVDMFAWLAETKNIIEEHPDTLFVVRAHPDEKRPGSDKQSRETVQDWVAQHGMADLPNVVFIDSLEYISSYELIQQSKFVLAYNSSVALESVLLDKLPVGAGWAWYAEYPTGVFPQTQAEYRKTVTELLETETPIHVPEEFRQNARSLLYYQNFRCSVPFGRYLEPHQIIGYARFKPFDPAQLSAEKDVAIQSVLVALESDVQVVATPAED